MMMGIITAIILWISGMSTSSTSPQFIAQQPTYQFSSTSQMQPATAWGEKRTYTQPFSADAPGTSSSPRRTRRGGVDPGDTPGGGDGPGGEPGMPIGDIPWIMMLLLAGGYIAYTTYSRKRQRLHAAEK